METTHCSYCNRAYDTCEACGVKVQGNEIENGAHYLTCEGMDNGSKQTKKMIASIFADIRISADTPSLEEALRECDRGGKWMKAMVIHTLRSEESWRGRGKVMRLHLLSAIGENTWVDDKIRKEDIGPDDCSTFLYNNYLAE
jgi:hypothetical protein